MWSYYWLLPQCEALRAWRSDRKKQNRFLLKLLAGGQIRARPLVWELGLPPVVEDPFPKGGAQVHVIKTMENFFKKSFSFAVFLETCSKPRAFLHRNIAGHLIFPNGSRNMWFHASKLAICIVFHQFERTAFIPLNVNRHGYFIQQ